MYLKDKYNLKNVNKKFRSTLPLRCNKLYQFKPFLFL